MTKPPGLIFAVHARDIAPDLWDRFPELSPTDADAAAQRILSGYKSWIEAVRARSQALSPGDVFDQRTDGGRREEARRSSAEKDAGEHPPR